MLDLSGQRSAGLKLSRSCPVVLGGTEYTLRVLTIAANERWNAQLNTETATLVHALTRKGVQVPDILAALAGQTDQMIELLVAYDRAGAAVLPSPEAIREAAYADELINAVREVWRAANPLVAIGLRALESATTTSSSSEPTSTPPTPTASRRKRSGTN